MDVATIKEAFSGTVLWCCLGAVGLMALAGLGVAAWKTPGKIMEVARKRGWLYVVVMGAFMAVATDAGSPTREDKERDRMRREQQAAEDAAWNAALGIGGLEAMGGVDRRLAASLGDTEPSGGLSEGMAAGGLPAPQETAEGTGAVMPSVRSLTESDYAAGLALARIGTDETFDFAPPEGADVHADWTAYGAAKDWFKAHFTNDWSFVLGTNVVDALTVFSYGTARPRMKDRETFISPLETSLGIVPAANWEQLDCGPSQFWQYLTPSNTLVMTWRNALFNRDANSPVSFQMECWPDGCIAFRYDLSRLSDDVVSNLVVGVSNAGEGRVFTALAKNTTSLRWARLDPTRPLDVDPDGDGLTTDEEIFIYGTDPYVADTDLDGLTDGQEIDETHTDPLDAHSLDPRYPDGMAYVIGDLDPFSCPPGSTNTVWEHVFYTGTTNAPFAYPQSTDDTAVLRMTVSGSGTGELIVGDQVVPLLGPSSSASTRAAARGARSAGDFGTPLLVRVAKGEDARLYLRGDDGLSVDLDSGDFAFGVLPSWSAVMGFVNFPNTKAETPCIHDFNARRKRVSLPVRNGAALLTCAWQGSGMDVVIENEVPRSALITASFPAGTSRGITYTLSHPLYLFGRTTYAQTVKFCPKPNEPGEDDPDPEPEPTPPWFDDGEDDDSDGDNDDHDESWCCHWGTCRNDGGTCSCGCDCCGSLDEGGWSEGEEPEATCPQHHVPYEQCASLHDDAYTNATWRAEELRDVLKIRDPLDYDPIHLPCPDSYHRCCDCPDHCTNYVAVAYKSYRLSLIDECGNNFSRAVDPCTVRVAGVHPSASVGDATLGFVTNGVVFRTYNYTVLGVGISKPSGPSLSVYNSLSQVMGVPMTVTTNLNQALQLNLHTNVRLPSGNVQFSIDAAEGAQFTVWMYDYGRGQYRRLLDTDGRAVVNLPISGWRRLVGGSSQSYSPVTPIYVTSAAKGAATLRFGYWCVVDGKVVQDWQSQEITSVEPPLLPDYNRDGRADEAEVEAHMRGQSFWYWQNQDTLRGEFIPEGGGGSVLNTSDDEVNGPLDLVNFFPVALRVSELVNYWDAGVSCYIESDAGADSFKFCFADVPWSGVGTIQTNDVRTLGDQRLCHSELVPMPENGWRIPSGTLGGFSENSGILVAEAVSPYASFRLTFRVGNEVLYSYALPMTIVPVRDMYRFYSLRGAETVDCGTFALPRSEWAHELPDEKDLDIFFTHGFNVGPDAARIWGDVLFKRFWLAGSRARFNMVTWAGDYNWTGSWANGLHYQQDAYQAQMTGDALKRLIVRGQPDSSKRILMTQSLGNMVACEALREGLNVAKYFMFDAAVASEAIDGSLQSTNSTDAAFSSYVPSGWRAYTPLCWSACWFRWFEGDAVDARGQMGWPDRFAAALDNAGEVYNYYSTGDEVFHNTASTPWLLEGMLESTANYCWQKQETLKGSGLPGGTAYGGWDFHRILGEALYDRISAGEAVASGSVTNAPVFNRGYSPMFSREASQEEVFMSLAKYVPAVSSAVGGRSILESAVENHDLNEGTVYRDGWGRDSDDGEIPWKHSDMKDMAYRHVYKLYLQLVMKGALQ